MFPEDVFSYIEMTFILSVNEKHFQLWKASGQDEFLPATYIIPGKVMFSAGCPQKTSYYPMMH